VSHKLSLLLESIFCKFPNQTKKACCERSRAVSAANWPIARPHSQKGAEQKVEQPDKSAADFEQKGLKRGRTCFPPLIPSKCYYFPTHTNKNSVFLKSKFLQKVTITGGNFFPQRSNFSSALAEKFCKEYAALASGKKGRLDVVILLSYNKFT
jgi:hypothetical protein